LVLVLIGAGLVETGVRRAARAGSTTGAGEPTRSPGGAAPGPGPGNRRPRTDRRLWLLLAALPATALAAGLSALTWTAYKVGALSYGGGFVIIPLMHDDAVERHGWMTDPEFLNAVALGQITPGPVVQTVSVVGWAAGGLLGALVAAVVAFGPSFLLVVWGGRSLDRLRAVPAVRGFFHGAGPAVVGAIAGSTVPLALALSEPWQAVVLLSAAGWLIGLRRGVV
ncbi:chromate transporter, partial [Streptomyces alkaliphilus]